MAAEPIYLAADRGIASTWLYEVHVDPTAVWITLQVEPDNLDALGHCTRLQLPRRYALEIGRALATLEDI